MSPPPLPYSRSTVSTLIMESPSHDGHGRRQDRLPHFTNYPYVEIRSRRSAFADSRSRALRTLRTLFHHNRSARARVVLADDEREQEHDAGANGEHLIG